MKKHTFQENYEIKSVDEGWFDNISQAAQKAYIQKFPNSKFAMKKRKKQNLKHQEKRTKLSTAIEKTEKLYKKHGDKFQKLDKEIDKLGMSIRDNDDGTGRYDDAVKDMKKKMKNLKSWKSHHLDKALKAKRAGEMAQAKLGGMKSPKEPWESIRPMESIQETLTINGKQYRRISEGVKKQPKPKYEFSEFYKRFKR